MWLSISIDTDSAGASCGESFTWTARRVVDLFARAGRTATWIAAEPADSQVIAWAIEQNATHEAALRVHSSPSNESSGNRFAAELIGRKRAAEQAGIAITTLAMTDEPQENLDLLIRQGITAVRVESAVASTSSRRRAMADGLNSLRYGLSLLAVDLRLTGGGRLSQWKSVRRIRRAIDRSITAKRACHLSIDLTSLATSPAGDPVRGLQKVLRHIERREREGVLYAGTIADTVARLTAPRTGRAAQSILRAA